MEYVFLFFLIWFLLCLPAIVYAAVIESRRKKDAKQFEEQISQLNKRFDGLQEQLKTAITRQSVSAVQEKPVPVVPVLAPAPIATHAAKKITVPEESPSVTPAPETVKPAVATPPRPVPLPPAPPVFPVRPEPKVEQVPRIPDIQPVQSPPPALPIAPVRVQAPSPPQFRQTLPLQTELTADVVKPEKKRRLSASMEEAVGTNWFPKIGAVLLVIGTGFFLASYWAQMSALTRIALFYVVGGGSLGAGIYWEKKENFKVLGRVLIGSGWAILYITTAAAHHWPSARIVDSVAWDLILLLLVAGLMVWHTLKYNSPTVTGMAFLLGFVALTLSHTTPYSLLAGLILVSSMIVIVLRRQWFELEVFGILASYLSHLYWLYWIIHPMGEQKHIFPEFWISVALLAAFWLIFRIAYLLHRISTKEQELVSTLAALLNPILFLTTLRYQAFETKWAFATLLSVGAFEFFFGQLPIARRRKVPFQLLSGLGAFLMVLAVPYKYSGNNLVLLWLAGAQAFLMAGIFVQEKLFRWFGGITFLLAAFYLLPTRMVPLVDRVLTGAPVHNIPSFVILAVAALVFYANAHLITRIWPNLFQNDSDRQAIHGISWFASLFAAGSVYLLVPVNGVAVVLAVLAFVLVWLGKQFNIPDTVYHAHWIFIVAVIDVTARGLSLESFWHEVPERILMFGAVAGLLYLSSRLVRLSGTFESQVFSVVYRSVASGLITILIWRQASDWFSAVLWTGFALVLSIVAQVMKANEFRWQAFVLVMLASMRALVVNFNVDGEFHGISFRLISVSLIAAGAYLLVARRPHSQLHPAYTCAGTLLLTYLAFKEAGQLWIAVAWAALGAILAFAGRHWRNRVLFWQSHTLAVLAAWAVFRYNFQPQYRQSGLQAITVLITSALLYLSTWTTKLVEVIEDVRISYGYSWIGSLLLTWLVWYQSPAINVALAWAIVGLALFEFGFGNTSPFLRAQGYVALVSSFIRIFFANLNSTAIDSALLKVTPLVLFYFWVYGRLHIKKTGEAPLKVRVEYILACVGTATVAALARFVPQNKEIIVVWYALIVVALLAVAWRTGLKIFLYQALVMLGVTAFRLSSHNFYMLQNSFSSSTLSSVVSILLLAMGIPIGFQLRQIKAEGLESENPKQQSWISALIRRPEQSMFFVPVVLMAIFLVIKIDLGWNLLALAAEGVVIALGAFLAKERSFRLTGLGLLLLCVVKLFVWDYWRLTNPQIHSLSFMGLGILMLVVAYLFSRNRKAIREWL
jgi:cbb3-type cytochrome oxidase subunit 3